MQYKMDLVPAFYAVIYKHLLAGVSIVIFEDDLVRAKERIWSDNITLVFSPKEEMSVITKIILIDQLNRMWHNPQSIPGRRIKDVAINNRDRLDFYFDEDSGSAWIGDWWDEHYARSKNAAYLGPKPRFEDDEQFLPLQAADFWAWWSRRASEDDTFEMLKQADFGTWRGEGSLPGLRFAPSEDEITQYLINAFRSFLPLRHMANIYDAKVTPKTEHAMSPFIATSRASMLSVLEKALKGFRRRR